MAVYQLIYRSVATRLFGGEELARMVEQARIYNYSQAITGVLFHAAGRFLQVLEGEMEQVEALYEYIRQDARHTGVVRMHSAAVAQRQFPAWSLGFGQVAASAMARLNGYLDPECRAALLPGTYDVGAFIADTLEEFVLEELAVVPRTRTCSDSL